MSMSAKTGPISWKTRLLSAVNNARHNQYFKIRFAQDEPIWMLGIMYHPKSEGGAAGAEEGGEGAGEDEPHIAELLLDIRSRMWMTYRQGFAPILDSKFTSDVGWGCMVRSGQMLLAQALVLHLLGREWRLTKESREQQITHRRIIRLFDDHHSPSAPFSIHNLLALANSEGIRAGQWQGPSQICRTLGQAINSSQQVLHDNDFPPLVAYLAYDCIICKEEVDQQIASIGEEWCSIFILVPLRLGIDSVTDVYVQGLKAMLMLPQCVGIIGGKPKHSLYFLGYQGNDVLGLDPHNCRNVLNTDTEDFDTESFHCASPRKMAFSSMDPSLAIGFFCHSRADLDAFYKAVADRTFSRTSLFTVVDSLSSSSGSV